MPQFHVDTFFEHGSYMRTLEADSMVDAVARALAEEEGKSLNILAYDGTIVGVVVSTLDVVLHVQHV